MKSIWWFSRCNATHVQRCCHTLLCFRSR